MKKITTLLFILITMPFYGQWAVNYVGTSDFNDVLCLTDDIVFVVGDDGTILKTTDGGTNWIQKISGTNNDLNKVQFVNSNIGYAIGANGTLLKTTDGGENWLSITTNFTTNLSGLCCLSENIFYVGEDSGYLRKTSNGGFSFETLNFGTAGFRDNVRFFNEMIGYANSYDVGLLKTTDGGNSWSVIESDVFSFFFLNENIGFVNSLNGLQKTIDGGLNFTFLSDISFAMRKLFAPTENIIWGVSQDFLLGSEDYYTMRGEINDLDEFQMTLNNNPLFNSIHFSSATMGYAVINEYIFKNSTGQLLDVPKVDLQKKTKIFPNPATNQITISFDNLLKERFEIEIIDVLGKKIYSNSYLNQNNIPISTAMFSQGVYLININSQGKKQIEKLVIN